jgi:hypothetical protein
VDLEESWTGVRSCLFAGMMAAMGRHPREAPISRLPGGPIIRRPRRQTTPVLEIAQAERQQIVVVPDEVFEQVPAPLIDGSTGAVGRIGYGVRRRLPPQVPGSINHAVDARLQAVNELRDEGVPILPVTSHQASRLKLPIGHPRIGLIYVCDPADGERYWPAAEFHRRVFEHKFAEAARLLMALGACSMQVRSERGWSGEMAAGMLAPLRGVLSRSGRATATAERSSEMLLEASLQPSGPPELPGGLIWYAQEPSWQTVAEGRLHRGLSDFALRVDSSEDYGLNADFEVKARRVKLFQLGGQFTAHKATTWVIEGRFAQQPQPLVIDDGDA